MYSSLPSIALSFRVDFCMGSFLALLFLHRRVDQHLINLAGADRLTGSLCQFFRHALQVFALSVVQTDTGWLGCGGGGGCVFFLHRFFSIVNKLFTRVNIHSY